MNVASSQTKLLIVDDDMAIRNSLCLVFTALGYSVRSAESGLAALSQIQHERPDVLISDLNMPGMSGFELLSEVHHTFPSILPVAMSGAFADNIVPTGVVAAAFYPKGSNLGYLLRIVKAMERAPRSLN